MKWHLFESAWEVGVDYKLAVYFWRDWFCWNTKKYITVVLRTWGNQNTFIVMTSHTWDPNLPMAQELLLTLAHLAWATLWTYHLQPGFMAGASACAVALCPALSPAVSDLVRGLSSLMEQPNSCCSQPVSHLASCCCWPVEHPCPQHLFLFCTGGRSGYIFAVEIFLKKELL